MEQSLSSDANRNFLSFMEPEGSLPY